MYGYVRDRALAFLNFHPVRGDLRCDACAIVEMLVRRNLTLDLHGDSVTVQTFNGFLCELRRRGYLVHLHHSERVTKKRRWRYVRDCLVLPFVFVPSKSNEGMRRPALTTS